MIHVGRAFLYHDIRCYAFLSFVKLMGILSIYDCITITIVTVSFYNHSAHVAMHCSHNYVTETLYTI